MFRRTGIPAMRGAVSSRPWISGFELRSAVRYPCVSHAGNSMPKPERSDVK
jgi:hypothetical protein